MSKKKMFILLFAFMVVLIGFRSIWFFNSLQTDQPFAEDGLLDLTKVDMDHRDIFTLNGEWTFYPNVWLTPEFAEGSTTLPEADAIKVPSNWFSNDSFNKNMKDGTYRLTIQVDDDQIRKYGLKIRRIYHEFALYVNGELVEQKGNPYHTTSSNDSTLVPSVTTIMSDSEGTIDLLLAVSASEAIYDGGIIGSVRFGTEKAIMNDHTTTASLQLMMAVIMFLHSAYTLILFLIKSKKKEILYFSVASFFAGCSVLVSDDRFLLEWFQLDIELLLKLLYFSYTSLSLFYLLFMKNFFKVNRLNPLIYTLTTLSGLYALFILIAPLYLVREWSFLLTGVLFSSFFTIAFLCLQLLLRRERDSLFLLLAAICVVSSVFWGVLKSNATIISESFAIMFDPNFYPLDFILAFICFSTFWFLQFFRAGDHNVELVHKLHKEHERKDQFLANTAHELRNPLHAMLNMAQAVSEDHHNQLSLKGKDELKLLMTVGRRMSYLLNDLIDVTKMEQMPLKLNQESLELKPVIKSVIDMQTFMMQEKKVPITLEIPDSFPPVYADQNRLIQILFNLLHNAGKFTDEGQIHVLVQPKKEFAIITVQDTGIGINKERQKQIFEPYEQGNNSSYDESGGLGLGLSICKQLVELHGGTLTVQSTPFIGSSFAFSLPYASELPQKDTPSTFSAVQMEIAGTTSKIEEKQASSLLKSKAKILAIDDDPLNLKVLKSILSSEDYKLETALTPQIVMERIDEDWDLIIADVMMPAMSGYELTKRIRQQYTISERPILLLTARNQPEDIYNGFLSGANDYVVKPVDSLELKVRTEALINLKHSVHERSRLEAAWLQAQIQPHFLFNTLNTIASLSEIDTERMSKMLQAFGHYLRASFDERNLNQLVPLKHEIDLLQSYLHIEQERFGSRLIVKWKLDPNISCEIPPLSIQPIVENAIRHGVLKRREGGQVEITIKREMTSIRITISDNGVGMTAEKIIEIFTPSHHHHGIGLLNTDTRLKQLYGTGLLIESKPNIGTNISFEIPDEKH
ncbi:hypothetical protein BTS2_0321 [Bacillus sp. TS-2]|nr:hypothetical protein BTS2_0321 [Bacillus sp. TS-2]